MTRPSPAINDTSVHADAIAAAVERARRLVPFYEARLAGHGGADLAELPTCTKADLAGWGPFPLQAGPIDTVARFAATSGTTGRRMFVGYSPTDWERIAAQLEARAEHVGLGPGDLLANTHGYGLWIGGPTLDLMATRGGAALLPCGPGSPEQITEWLSTMPVTAMSATPSYVRLLAERVASGSIDASGWQLRLGLIGGEPASIELRRQVVGALAASGIELRWQELYGSTEVGGPVLGWSPPADPWAGTLLVDTDELVVELLHPERDEPVAPGETGEITITTPWREASPLIRYRTRDLAVEQPGAVDGWPVLSSIVGRIDDALKVRGALVHPGAIERVVVARCAPGAEWRIVVRRAPGELDVLTVVVEHDEPSMGYLGAALADAIGVRCEVAVVAPGTLERFSGKARRVTDDR